MIELYGQGGGGYNNKRVKAMSTNPPKLSLIDIFLISPVADLLKQKDGYKKVEPELLKALCTEIIEYQKTIDWNAYNDVMLCGVLPENATGFEKAREIPPAPRPFASWIEVAEQLFGGLADLEREPSDYRIPFVIEHKYKPDNICKENDRIIFEIKGVIRTLEESRKYRCVAKQWNVHFVFVFQCKNIICPWARPRVDGSRMTHEQWCENNGFDYCYVGQTEEFRKSTRFKHLVNTVGRGLPTLKQELARGKKLSIFS